MKKRSILAVILAVLLTLTLTACGGSAGGTKMESAPSASAPMAPAMTEESKTEAPADMMYATGDSATGGAAKTEDGALPQKLIRTARLEMETTAFDDATKALADMTERLGGYYENSSMANYRSGARWAESTIRIPAEKLDMFLSGVGELCHVTWQELMQDDVSEAYYDTEGRLKTQKIKLERLQNLLAKAGDI